MNDRILQEEIESRLREDYLDMRAEQEQARDYHRAKHDLDHLFVKMETGMATVEDVNEARKLVNFLTGANI
jgi:hypothetical protein